MRQRCRSVVTLAAAVVALLECATPFASAQAASTQTSADEGIPIRSELVRSRCGSCHRTDDKMRMSRISYRRASPENWELTIKRMVSLNNVSLDPNDARAILKHLSDELGLAPEEVRPAAFETERRLVDFAYAADKNTSDTCTSCHSPGRFMLERRTKDEWDLLVAMHRGYYPLVDNQPMNGGQGFRRTRPLETNAEPDGPPRDTRHPMERALTHLAKAFPLTTPEWATWSSAKQSPKLAGRWAMTGYQVGKGSIIGQVTIAADPSAPDNFTTEMRYTVARTGETVSRTGRALVYTGFQWRGRSGTPGTTDSWREVLAIDRGWREMTGRWFTGAHDEIGIDVTLTRVGSDPLVLGTSVTALKTGTTVQSVRIFGGNLPATVTAGDISVGQGVTVTRVASARPEEIVVDLDVAANAPVGRRAVSVAGAVSSDSLAVYDMIDGLKVLPAWGMARVGANVFPKQLQQFEAVGLNNGADRKAGTADDLTLGMVDVTWRLEEYSATFADDDIQFVGSLDARGLFTPAADGPNPKRSGERNNVGDVWVVAELAAPLAGSNGPIRARAHLLVTVPLYMDWSGRGGVQAGGGSR